MTHANLGRSGAFRMVLDLLGQHKDGLTSTQVVELAVSKGLVKADETEAEYYRVKRALTSLEGLGYVRCEEQRTRAGKTYVVVPGAIDEDLKRELKKGLDQVMERIKNRIPLNDAGQLMAAFEGVIDESAMEMGLPPRKAHVGRKGLEIRKRK